MMLPPILTVPSKVEEEASHREVLLNYEGQYFKVDLWIAIHVCLVSEIRCPWGWYKSCVIFFEHELGHFECMLHVEVVCIWYNFALSTFLLIAFNARGTNARCCLYKHQCPRNREVRVVYGHGCHGSRGEFGVQRWRRTGWRYKGSFCIFLWKSLIRLIQDCIKY